MAPVVFCVGAAVVALLIIDETPSRGSFVAFVVLLIECILAIVAAMVQATGRV
jgi:hypothetical protein